MLAVIHCHSSKNVLGYFHSPSRLSLTYWTEWHHIPIPKPINARRMELFRFGLSLIKIHPQVLGGVQSSWGKLLSYNFKVKKALCWASKNSCWVGLNIWNSSRDIALPLIYYFKREWETSVFHLVLPTIKVRGKKSGNFYQLLRIFYQHRNWKKKSTEWMGLEFDWVKLHSFYLTQVRPYSYR